MSSTSPNNPAELWTIIQQLQQTVAGLNLTLESTRAETQQAVNAARQEIETLRAATAIPAQRIAPSSSSRVKVNSPKEFSNDRSVARDFISQCEMVYEAQPDTYHSERLRVLYACSFLRGEAFKWYQTVSDNGNLTAETNFTDFKLLFQSAWADTELKRNASDQIQTFKQTGKATVYASKFNYLAALTEFNDAGLRTFFYNGLKETIKDLLLSKPQATTLKELQEQAIECDILVNRREKERKKNSITSSVQASTPTSLTPTIPAPRTGNGPTPMDLDHIKVGQPRGPLSPAEKLRRAQEKLCIYCGEGSCAGAANVELCPKLIKRNQGKVKRQI
jgi:hypothetical protein